jgi:hypothetical protein
MKGFIIAATIIVLVIIALYFIPYLYRKFKFKSMIKGFESGDIILITNSTYRKCLVKWDTKAFVYLDTTWDESTSAYVADHKEALQYAFWDSLKENQSHKMRKLDTYMKNKGKNIISLNRKDKIGKLV